MALLALLLSLLAAGDAATLTLYNKCKDTVWPGIRLSTGHPIIARGGFRMNPDQAFSLRLPHGWSGHVWGFHGCHLDPATSCGRCATIECGGSLFYKCPGREPPCPGPPWPEPTSPSVMAESTTRRASYWVEGVLLGGGIHGDQAIPTESLALAQSNKTLGFQNLHCSTWSMGSGSRSTTG